MNDFSSFQPEFYRMQNEFLLSQKTKEIKALRKLSLLAGSAVLLYVLIQNIIFVLVELFGLLELYRNNVLFGGGIDILMTILGVFLPFSLMGGKMKAVSGEAEPVLSEAPDKIHLLIFGAIGATGLVMLCNIISSYITAFISLFGYELASPNINMPDGVFGFALSMVRISILTAIVEEYSLRGHVLGNLRKYGDAFAIFMSAAVFSLMHGNLIQVPYAMLSGMVLGFFTLKTKSVWPAIFAHAVCNGLSVIASYLIEIAGEENALIIYSFVMYAIIFVGLIASFIFILSTRNRPLIKSESVLKPTEKLFHFLFTPTTLIAFLIMLYITATSVS